jgi:hypothetical protein
MIRYQRRDLHQIFFDLVEPMDSLDIVDMNVGNVFAKDVQALLDQRQISYEIKDGVGVFKAGRKVLTIGDMHDFSIMTRADAIRIRDFVMSHSAPIPAAA